MASRPGTRESRPSSSPESLGVGTIAASEGHFSPSLVAGDVAEDITSNMFDTVLNSSLQPGAELASAEAQEKIAKLIEDNSALRLEKDQLEAELNSARSEMEFAKLKEEELEDRNRRSQQSIVELEKQVGELKQKASSLESELEVAKKDLASGEWQRAQLEEKSEALAQLNKAAAAAKEKDPSPPPAAAPVQPEASLNNERTQALEAERDGLQSSLQRLQAELERMQIQQSADQTVILEQSGELAMLKGKEMSMEKSTIEPDSEEKPLLAAAYQQISVLNTQLATLYTELTMARTEVQDLRRQAANANMGRENPSANNEAEVLKQSQQIADLVSDIRHLQLDLEYHQQKLDQMIEEKQQMMRDLKRSQAELEDARRQIEEKDQMLKHREVDLKQLREESRSPRGHAGESEGGAALAALRAEAAAKDSALIVSHYELHKEKLLRDRLEQKNLKLMERMQKLMMVVETMRKENVTLERNLVAREQHCDTKDQQLRQVSQKAKKLEKFAKAAKAGQKSGGKTVLELGSPSKEALPPLDRSQRSIDSGRRSGASTPRTPRAPPSPYGARKEL